MTRLVEHNLDAARKLERRRSPGGALEPGNVTALTPGIAHACYDVEMKRLTPDPELYRPDDLVRPPSTADEHAATPRVPNTRPHRPTLTAVPLRGRHNSTIPHPKPTKTSQNRPPQTHDLQRTASLPPKPARESFFRRPHPGDAPSATTRPSTIRNRQKLIKIDHPERTISSAQQDIRRNTPEKFFSPRRSLVDTWTVRPTRNAAEQNRTASNARTHHVQRSAGVPRSATRFSSSAERGARTDQPTASCPRAA